MTREQFDELQELVLEAKDRLESNMYASGSHFYLMHLLGQYKVFAITREQTVEFGQKLCDEWIQAQNYAEQADGGKIC